jgi:DUF4097 and DUF4098 domain-containing protein YvlB
VSDRIESFEVGERVEVDASTTAGEIVVTPGSPGTVTVSLTGPGAPSYRVERRGDVISVEPERGGLVRRFSSTDVRLDVPPQTSLVLSSASGEIIVNAAVEDLTASSASGDVKAGAVARSAKIRTASGDVYLDRVGDRLGIETASGDVRVGEVGRDLVVTTASGDIWIDAVGESIEIRSASGDATIRRFEGSDLAAKTLSGDIRVGIPPHRLLEVDIDILSGQLRNRLPEGGTAPPEKQVNIRVKTVSGDVTLEGA